MSATESPAAALTRQFEEEAAHHVAAYQVALEAHRLIEAHEHQIKAGVLRYAAHQARVTLGVEHGKAT